MRAIPHGAELGQRFADLDAAIVEATATDTSPKTTERLRRLHAERDRITRSTHHRDGLLIVALARAVATGEKEEAEAEALLFDHLDHAIAAALLAEELTRDPAAGLTRLLHGLPVPVLPDDSIWRHWSLERLCVERERRAAAWPDALNDADLRADKQADAPGSVSVEDTREWIAAFASEGLGQPVTDVPTVIVPAPGPLPSATLVEARAILEANVRTFFAGRLGLDPPRILDTSEGATGKTHSAGWNMAQPTVLARRDGRPHRNIFMVPEHKVLGPQVTARFRDIGLSVAHHRGRTEDNCSHMEEVRAARKAGASPGSAVCKNGDRMCPDFVGCKYQAGLAAAADADVVIAANTYLFEELPAAVRQNVGWITVDEDFKNRGDLIRPVTLESFSAASRARFPVLANKEPDDSWSRRYGWLCEKLIASCTASEDSYVSAAALRGAGLTPAEADEACGLAWRCKVSVNMTPGMRLDDRKAEAARCAINSSLPRIAAVWRAAAAIMRGEDGADAGRLKLETVHTTEGDIRRFHVLEQRRPADWIVEIPIRFMNGTGLLADVEGFFPGTVEHTTPRVAAPHSRTVLILGTFGKSALGRSKRKQSDIAAYLTVQAAGERQGIISYLSTMDSFAKIEGAHATWHGANAGDDSMRDLPLVSVIGGRSAPHWEIANLAAARSGLAVPSDRPVSTKATVLMTDGTGREITVVAYEHPAAQAVHEGIYNADINQAAARARRITRTAASRCTVNIFANAVPDHPADVILNWRDIRPDRLVHMVARRRVPLNAALMTSLHKDLFRTEKAASSAREGFGDVWARLRDMCSHYWFPWSRVRYQPLGQGHKLSWTVCPTHELLAHRKEIENAIGGLEHWQPESFTEGRQEDIPATILLDKSSSGMSSPAPDPTPAAWMAAKTSTASDSALAPPDG